MDRVPRDIYMKNFHYKKRNLVAGPHLLGTLLMVAGIFALLSPTFLEGKSSIERVFAVGIGALLLGLVITFTYGGTHIDFKQKRFIEYLSIGGYSMGKWMPLPDLIKIKVISKSQLVTKKPNGISPTLSGKVTKSKILLYQNSSKPLFSFEYSNLDSAVKNAKRLAAELNAELVVLAEL